MSKKKKKKYLTKLNREEISSLYLKSETNCVSKTGNEYIDAVVDILSRHRKKKLNTSDYPIKKEEIISEDACAEYSAFNRDFIGIREFAYAGKFKGITIKYSKAGTPLNNEQIELLPESGVDDIINKKEGIAYILTCVADEKEYIIKIGETRKTFAERLKSYNCGYLNNIDTASKTNIRIVQTIVANQDLTFKIYLKDCSADKKPFDWAGKRSKEYPTSFRIAVQDITIAEYIRLYGRKPIGNVQVDTEEDY